ncbi:energy transducer TonB [uncultured Algibacter sp.]|uniref:energy transducer TonB n=1 Tax=uncultured Algibacter sp. TaxID=298659 RepID=UPI002602E651|nr:energy transducer TonB [uncultured Algibacter sp.]
MKKLQIILLIVSFNQMFSQNITNKTLTGLWEVNEVDVDSKIFEAVDRDKINSISSFFQTINFAFSKNGLVEIKTEKTTPLPFNHDIFNKVLYYNTENNIISIGNKKKSSNILYIQANQENNFLLFNFIGARLKLKKNENSCKLKINKNSIQSVKTLLYNKPFTYVSIDENDIISDDINIPAKTYNCSHLKDKALLKRCVSQTITWFFSRKFNPEIASNIGLTGRLKNKIHFIIDKEGNVVNIKIESKNPELSDEISHTINLLPRFIPAKNNGKNVNSKYSFPFIFHVQD